jgi:hypothetical protein
MAPKSTIAMLIIVARTGRLTEISERNMGLAS